MGYELARALRAGCGIQYDTQCKKVLSQKTILAWVLKYATEEFKDMPLAEIEKYIVDAPEVSMVRVQPGETNIERMGMAGKNGAAGEGNTERIIGMANSGSSAGEIPAEHIAGMANENDGNTDRIIGMANEDSVTGEGTIWYDIRFCVSIPNGGSRMRMLINLEAQKDYYPGYEIVTRGIFYGSRMISAQLGTEFEMPNYDDIKKVYSIWVCMNAPKYIGNAVSDYQITKRDVYGGLPENRKAYDKMTVVIVALNEKKETENVFLGMLNTLLSPVKSYEEKKTELEGKYHIKVQDDMAKEMNTMCNLSEYVEQIGMEKGLERGRQEGLETGLTRGRQEGLETGLTQGIHALIDMCREFCLSQADTLTKIQEKFSVTEERAQECMKLYWK